MSDKRLDDGPSERAAAARRVHDALIVSVEEMRRCLGLDRDTAAILDEIKKTMHVAVPPYGFTVIQALGGRESEGVFNQFAADEFPKKRQEFEHAIQDFVGTRGGRVPVRRIYKIARNAWKQDPGANRRTREMEQLPPDQFHSPYRGQPQLYDREVVLAFANAITRATGKSHFSWTRGTEDNKSSGVMLDVLVAAVQWAMCVAWQCSAPRGTDPPNVKAEGLLGILKAQRKKSTD